MRKLLLVGKKNETVNLAIDDKTMVLGSTTLPVEPPTVRTTAGQAHALHEAIRPNQPDTESHTATPLVRMLPSAALQSPRRISSLDRNKSKEKRSRMQLGASPSSIRPVRRWARANSSPEWPEQPMGKQPPPTATRAVSWRAPIGRALDPSPSSWPTRRRRNVQGPTPTESPTPPSRKRGSILKCIGRFGNDFHFWA